MFAVQTMRICPGAGIDARGQQIRFLQKGKARLCVFSKSASAGMAEFENKPQAEFLEIVRAADGR
jgi:hypothetical protein